MNCDLKIGSISDIHWGHPNTTTEEILDNMRRDFDPSVIGFTNLDLFVIDGDAFDRQLSLGDPQCSEIKRWINDFLRTCKKHDIVVRILEGTPSHDWKQSKVFIDENEMSQIGCDIRYFQKLDIEYIERFDINVLYVPDEWRADPDETWMEVTALLAEKGLTQVDFALMHGTFEHQLPSHIKTHRHLNARYESIVKYFIFVGHIHLHSVNGKIISNGSYDRVAHGEEGPKGYVRVHARLNGKHEILFVENIGAKIYKTIDCRGLSIEESLSLIDNNAYQPCGSFMRIRANREEPVLTAIDVIRRKYPAFSWSVKVDASTTASFADVQANLKTVKRTTSITRDNIAMLVAKRLERKQLDPVLADRALLLLNEVLKHGISGS